jgi:hypothetical protein
MDSIELAIYPTLEDSIDNLVGKVANIFQESFFCDSLKQSIKLSFCGTS